MRVVSFEPRGSIALTQSNKPGVSEILFEDILLSESQFLELMSNQGSGPRGTESSGNNANEMIYNLLKRQSEDPSGVNHGAKKQRTTEEGDKARTPPSAGVPSVIQGPPQYFFQNQSLGFADSPASLASSLLLNDQYARAELQARQIHQEMTVSRNAALVASLLGQSQNSAIGFPPFQQQLMNSSIQGQPSSSVLGGSSMDHFISGLISRSQPFQGIPPSSLSQQLQQSRAAMATQSPVDVNAFLRQLTWPGHGTEAPRAIVTSSPQGTQGQGKIRLPPCDDGLIPPYTEREKYPLGIDEDPNWLSEFHCFVRSELAEICRASHDDCKTRNNATSFRQVGIRCRFCAHKPPTGRGCRSSAYPSSIRQIYQSFTMMLRDHFGSCEAMPEETKKRFIALKDKPSQGATDSKRYWIYSAMKAGLADSPDGIIMDENSVLTGLAAPPFASETPMVWQQEAAVASPLVTPSDSNLGSCFLRCLLAQAQVVQLRDSERIGNRRSLERGLPGFSCRHCWEKRRLGLCRMFPARRRTLSQKLTDLYDHLRRCQATPDAVKHELDRHRSESKEENLVDSGDTKALLDRVWTRLGHGNN